jgi:hypothetical protein
VAQRTQHRSARVRYFAAIVSAVVLLIPGLHLSAERRRRTPGPLALDNLHQAPSTARILDHVRVRHRDDAPRDAAGALLALVEGVRARSEELANAAARASTRSPLRAGAKLWLLVSPNNAGHVKTSRDAPGRKDELHGHTALADFFEPQGPALALLHTAPLVGFIGHNGAIATARDLHYLLPRLDTRSGSVPRGDTTGLLEPLLALPGSKTACPAEASNPVSLSAPDANCRGG